MARIFSQVDLLLVPSLRDEMLIISNFTGHPSLTLRAGFVEVSEARSDWAPDPAHPLPTVHPAAPRAARRHAHRPAVRRGHDRARRARARARARRGRRTPGWARVKGRKAERQKGRKAERQYVVSGFSRTSLGPGGVSVASDGDTIRATCSRVADWKTAGARRSEPRRRCCTRLRRTTVITPGRPRSCAAMLDAWPPPSGGLTLVIACTVSMLMPTCAETLATTLADAGVAPDVRPAGRRDPRLHRGGAEGRDRLRAHASRGGRRADGGRRRSDRAKAGRLPVDARSWRDEPDARRRQRLSRSLAAHRHHRDARHDGRALRDAPAPRSERGLPAVHQADDHAGRHEHGRHGQARVADDARAALRPGAPRAAERRRAPAGAADRRSVPRQPRPRSAAAARARRRRSHGGRNRARPAAARRPRPRSGSGHHAARRAAVRRGARRAGVRHAEGEGHPARGSPAVLRRLRRPGGRSALRRVLRARGSPRRRRLRSGRIRQALASDDAARVDRAGHDRVRCVQAAARARRRRRRLADRARRRGRSGRSTGGRTSARRSARSWSGRSGPPARRGMVSLHGKSRARFAISSRPRRSSRPTSARSSCWSRRRGPPPGR